MEAWLIIPFLILGLLYPQPAAVLLFLFTDWFDPLRSIWFWAILGFLFLPYTFLWYSVVVNFFGGTWSIFQVIGLIVALGLDIHEKIV